MDKRGYQLKLEKEVKKLNTPEVSSGVPVRLRVAIAVFTYVVVYSRTLFIQTHLSVPLIIQE